MPRTTKIKFGTGAVKDAADTRDRLYDGVAFSAAPFDWEAGYDIEKVIDHSIPIKNQDGSSSCVGQAWSYYIAILDTIETKEYTDVSAKAIYSQIALPQGGAYIRDGGKLAVDWGAISEKLVPSYDNGQPPSESFIKNSGWKKPEIDSEAKILSAKEYRMINDVNMEIIAQSIRDNYGVVGGVSGSNNGTWSSLEPKIGSKDWGHALFFGKAGIDDNGKWIGSPNSWGDRFKGQWQKFRAEWFTNNFMFNPWLIVDQPNTMSPEIMELIKQNDKGMLIENEAPGRKGIIYGGKLMEVVNGREGNAALYLIENKTFVRRITKSQFNQIPKGNSF
jgi:hypothetical protein